MKYNYGNRQKELKLTALILLSIFAGLILFYTNWDFLDLMNFNFSVVGIIEIAALIAIFRSIFNLFSPKLLFFTIIALLLLIFYSILRIYGLIIKPTKQT
jgi:hypothetical protein